MNKVKMSSTPVVISDLGWLRCIPQFETYMVNTDYLR